MNTYAGIGSRSTPATVLLTMTKIAQHLAARGYTLRSGAASGADAAFEAGATEKEIYLPWPRFNGHVSQLCSPTAEAMTIAAKFHPNWAACSQGARKLHARNCHQVLGPQLDDPVSFVVCWTPAGTGSGGTGQALRIAKAHDIPVFDLGLGVTTVLARLASHLNGVTA